MGLRIDLANQLTPEMLLKGALANQHRYQPAPQLARTGVGSLTPTTEADRKRDRRIRKKTNVALLRAVDKPPKKSL